MIPDMRFHALRHSFVAACASRDMTWEQTSALTGHKTYATYLRYKHLFEKEQKRLLERWDDD
jgi:integrase